MNIKNSVLDYIRCKQLNWYGHVMEQLWNGIHLEEEEEEEEKEDFEIIGYRN